MANHYFKIVKGKYDNESAIFYVIRYVRNSKKNPHGISNIHEDEIEKIAEEFLQIQKKYRNEKGKRVRHFYLSFPKNCNLSYKAYIHIAFHIVDYFKNYQIIFGLHEFDNDGRPCQKHIHFALNPINYKTGKRIKLNRERLFELHRLIDSIVAEYSID